MSRLDNLIDQYCPNGVKFESLGNIVKFINGRAYKQTELLDSGKYRVLRVGNFFTNDRWYYSNLELDEEKYCNNGDLLYAWAASLGPQIWEGEKTIFHYHIWKLEFDENVIIKKYLYHFLLKDVNDIYGSLTHSTMPHVSMANMKERKIPVPPVEVQREIVRVLDTFTFLSAKLSAELSARKKQYEYYREKLLTYGESIPQMALDELCYISAGGDAPKEQMSKEKTEQFTVPIISNGIGENALYGYTNEPRITKPAVTIAARGTIGYAEYRDYPYFPIIRLLSVIPKDKTILNTKYLYYCLQGKHYSVPTSGIPQLTAPMLKKEIIPVPPMNVQERVVRSLDVFELICTDLYKGLPAEIEARKKQYEHYRDKLLTFMEL